VKNRKVKVYQYSGCSTCRKALKFLNDSHIAYESIPIRETPPTFAELKKAKQILGDLKKLFNVSGNDYRTGNWKERILNITEDEALKALSSNGNLVKRPFVQFNGTFLVGFKEEDWKKIFEDEN